MGDSDDDKPISAIISEKMNIKLEASAKLDASTKVKVEGEGKEGNDTTAKKADSESSKSVEPKPASSSSAPRASATAAALKISKSAKADMDSEDDLPIAELMKRRSRVVKPAPAPPAPPAKKAKVDTSDKEKEKPKGKEKEKEKEKEKKKSVVVEEVHEKASSEKKGTFTASPGIGSSFYETKKGLIAQRLLCRWWYIIDWPRLQDIGDPPPGFEPLEGFMGVFVSTRTDSLGTILDLRDRSEAPCLMNFAQKDALELKTLCIAAYENQITALTKAEGEGAKLLVVLKSEMKEVKAISANKAEEEAKKYNGDFFSK